MIPSTPSKPSDTVATPIDCPVISNPGPSDNVSVNSVPAYRVRSSANISKLIFVPEKNPEPYVTD